VSSYDPAKLLHSARIAENYCFETQGQLDEDEAMRCFTCGFQSLLPGTRSLPGAGSGKDLEPPVVELSRTASIAS
jgi:hypothetical protein